MQIDINEVKSIVDKWCDYVAERYGESEEAIGLVNAYIMHDLKVKELNNINKGEK